MSFTPLVDTWRQSRQERTDLTPGRRWAFMEADLGADMTVGRPRGVRPVGLEVDHEAATPEPDDEFNVEPEARTAQRAANPSPEQTPTHPRVSPEWTAEQEAEWEDAHEAYLERLAHTNELPPDGPERDEAPAWLAAEAAALDDDEPEVELDDDDEPEP